MAILEFPLFPSTPLFDERVTLDGVEFLIRFDYSAREDRWYFNLETTAGVKVITGRKVVPGWNVLQLHRSQPDCPRGVIWFQDPRSNELPCPGFAELGRSIRFFYFTADV